jgi:Cu2+-exporting ATPase
VTIFCGDGANDAIALAQATVGVHISAISDVAQSAADAVLLRLSLAGVLLLMDLSGAAVRRNAFSFAWSFAHNLFAILLAAGAFVKARIRPE